ncbi:MAG: flavodoxin [Erysipelotrichaceae bacterium]
MLKNKGKRILNVILAALLVLVFTSCGKQYETGINSPNEAQPSDNSILIVYFAVGENSGVEVVASASYTTIENETSGRVAALANMIKEKTSGQLFSIKTAEVYPANGSELIDFAYDEQQSNARPQLVNHIDNYQNYDTIFIGYPIWWYDLPMALYSFLEEYDFSGKTIIPFSVHNGSRFSNTIATIKQLQPYAVVVENGFTVSEQNVATASDDIVKWLNDLGY